MDWLSRLIGLGDSWPPSHQWDRWRGGDAWPDLQRLRAGGRGVGAGAGEISPLTVEALRAGLLAQAQAVPNAASICARRFGPLELAGRCETWDNPRDLIARLDRWTRARGLSDGGRGA